MPDAPADLAGSPLPAAPDRPRRLVFLGTPEVAVPPLRALHAAGFDIPLVVTRPDKKRGRGGALSPSPVKAAAVGLGLPVSHAMADAVDVGAELGVVVAYGRIIPTDVLRQLPMVNIHFSLLPRWRGAAPVERALLAGDRRTGVCLMEVAEGLDTGGVYASVETLIGPGETLATLRGRLVELGTDLLVSRLTEGLGTPVPQAGEPTYADKIDPSELAIDWARAAVELDRLVRLGGAHTTFRGKRLKVWAAAQQVQAVTPGTAPAPPATVVAVAGPGGGPVVATGEGFLELLEVQPEGKGRQPGGAWRNGAHLAVGDRLGS